jgi:adenosylmethionine-8-amino-7-oxononanoate aminotransferase
MGIEDRLDIPEAVSREHRDLAAPASARRTTAAPLRLRRGGELAAIVLDPMPSHGGLTEPTPEFIATVQQAAAANGILVIADEVLNLRQGLTQARHHSQAIMWRVVAPVRSSDTDRYNRDER